LKTLYLDTERSWKTLGTDKEILDIFGYPRIPVETWGTYLGMLFKSKSFPDGIFSSAIVDEVITLGPIKRKIATHRWFNAHKDFVLDCVVIDTFTEVVKQFQRDLAGSNSKMTMGQWGEMKFVLDKMLSVLSPLPVSLILNCHSKMVKDDTEGILKVQPYIEGSTKEDISKWFDFVFYTKVVKDKANKYHYVWVTKRDEKYIHAKDRSDSFEPEIPQDYTSIFNIVKEKKWDNAKVMVIGDPGSGKTYSLKTLKGVI